MAEDKHIVRTAGYDWSKGWRGRHPFNPASEMRMLPLARQAGMKRLGVNLIRIPPGRESFIPHAHAVQEEFVYVLEGSGEVVLDGARHAIGPGDFVGFPTDGVVHSVVSLGPGDLLYLTGGETSDVEIAEMPTIGKTTIFRNGTMTLASAEGIETMTEAEWMARTVIED
jgi:uncharacterized cupin superfamily protein